MFLIFIYFHVYFHFFLFLAYKLDFICVMLCWQYISDTINEDNQLNLLLLLLQTSFIINSSYLIWIWYTALEKKKLFISLLYILYMHFCWWEIKFKKICLTFYFLLLNIFKSFEQKVNFLIIVETKWLKRDVKSNLDAENIEKKNNNNLLENHYKKRIFENFYTEHNFLLKKKSKVHKNTHITTNICKIKSESNNV